MLHCDTPKFDALRAFASLTRCPHCGELTDVFPPVTDDRSLLGEVELLVSIPLNPALAKVDGVPPQFEELAARVEERLGQ